MIKKKYFLKIFFIILFVFSLVKLFDNSSSLDAWQYGEWLINYQHGFVRRGLVGEIIYLVATVFDNNIQIAFLLIVSTLCFFYYFLNYHFVKGLKLNFIYYLIIFSPLFYLFFVVISKIGIRKSIIFYIFYLLYLIYLSSKNFTLNKNWIFILFFPLLLLNHEPVFFYLPYVILPLFFVIKRTDLKYLIFQIVVLIIFSTLVMLLLYYNRGTLEHTVNICQSLGDYAPMKCDYWGPIDALSKSENLYTRTDNRINPFIYLSADYKTALGFLFYILYGFVPIFVFFKYASLIKTNFILEKKSLFLMCLATFAFSLPLFQMAEDWSRWFSIHFHLLAFFIFFLQRIGILNFENNLRFKKINIYLIDKKMKNFFIIILFVYATSFHHHHFFFEGVKLEFTYYKIFKKIKSKF